VHWAFPLGLGPSGSAGSNSRPGRPGLPGTGFWAGTRPVDAVALCLPARHLALP